MSGCEPSIDLIDEGDEDAPRWVRVTVCAALVFWVVVMLACGLALR